jgi:hypothetical protein
MSHGHPAIDRPPGRTFQRWQSHPFTHNVAVDEDRMLDIIDQMRIAIPEEVKKAQQLLGQRDRDGATQE